ncbi:MAG: response regulator [Proteobacteria bacterium]|nr:response regulator [Pseudomonadota bacterium]
MSHSILIVDDSPEVRDHQVVILQSAGFSVTQADSGIDALEIARGGDFDLMLVDISMSQMGGFGFCKELRSDEKYKDVPIIILATESEAEDRMKGFKAGANLYHVKPVKAEVLIENINILLSQV